MKNTNKMIKIPLEDYNRLIKCRDAKTDHGGSIISTTSSDIDPLERAKTNMAQMHFASNPFPKQQSSQNADEKWLRMAQEFKRFQKHYRDKQEMPVNVRVKNFADMLGQLASSSPTKKSRTPPQRAQSSAYSTAIGEEEEEEEADDGQPADFTSNIGEEEGEDDVFEYGEEDERKFEEIITEVEDYVRDKHKEFGVNQNLKLLHRLKGRLVPMKTGSVNKILRFHFLAPEGAKLPTGYNAFMASAQKDPYLRRQLWSSASSSSFSTSAQRQKQQQQQQTGSGLISNRWHHINRSGPARRGYFTQKRRNNNHIFKPTLWGKGK